MRILHTADWHVGKRLGRYDRMDDYRAVLDAIVEVAEREAVDLVLVAGDLFDRSVPSIEALRLVLDTLERLARGRRPVAAIAGNHDSAELFELLAPLVRPGGVHLVGTVRAPGDGGVLELATAGGELVRVACLPFLREGHAVDFLDDPAGWHGAYAERLDALCRAHVEHLGAQGDDAPCVLMAHFAVTGVRLGGAGAPRGERALHLGEAYAADPATLAGGGPAYVAMGHIHAPQDVPGAGVPARYAGSPLELDFGEAGEDKQVVIVDLEAGAPARVRPVRIEAGRKLIRACGPFERLCARPELAGAYLDLTVETAGPDPGLADRARDAFPLLAKVRAEYPRQTGAALEGPGRAVASWDALYADYHRQAHGNEPDPALLAAFREILDAVADASA